MSPDEQVSRSDEAAAVLAEVRADLIVRAIVRDLEERRSEPKKDTIWERPFARLIVPFLLTSVVGTWLATAWQTRQWTEQQEYATRQEETKQRIALLTTLTEKAGETFSASEDVLILHQLALRKELGKNRSQEMRERVSRWLEQNRKWRVDEKVLAAQMRASFSDPGLPHLFNKLSKRRRDLFFAVSSLLEETGGKQLPLPSDPRSEITTPLNNEATTIIRKTTGLNGLLSIIAQRMIVETRERQQRAPGVWSRAWQKAVQPFSVD